MTTDEHYMQRCLQLARNGVIGAPPNPMVGAVIVCDGHIIGEGYHARCGQGHAEVNAFASVSKFLARYHALSGSRALFSKDENEADLLKRSTLYVSLEPCAHYGKTPPCAKLIIEKGVKRVVVGCVDPFAKVHGRGIQMLKDAGIEVEVGVMEQECLALNRRFITFNTHHRPFITLKWAQTADGAMGRKNGAMLNISSPETFRRSHHLRASRMAIMVGYLTAAQDNPSLTTRLWDGPNPVRVVIDERGELPHTLRLFDGSAPTLVFTHHPERFADLEQNSVKPIALKNQALTAQEILNSLYQEGLQSLIIEGGAHTLQLFIDANLWDEAFVERSSLPAADLMPETDTPVYAPCLQAMPYRVLPYPRSLVFCYQNHSN